MNLEKIAHRMISSAMKDVKKIKQDDLSPEATNVLKALDKHSIKAKFDPDTNKGVMTLTSMGNVKFSVGGENFYLELGTSKPVFVKGAANELITALVKFDKIVGNY